MCFYNLITGFNQTITKFARLKNKYLNIGTGKEIYIFLLLIITLC